MKLAFVPLLLVSGALFAQGDRSVVYEDRHGATIVVDDTLDFGRDFFEKHIHARLFFPATEISVDDYELLIADVKELSTRNSFQITLFRNEEGNNERSRRKLFYLLRIRRKGGEPVVNELVYLYSAI